MDSTLDKGYGSEEEGNVSYGCRLHSTKNEFWHDDDSTTHGDQQGSWQRPTLSYKAVIEQRKSKVVPSDQVVEFAFDSAGSDEEVPIKKGPFRKEESIRSSGVKRAQSQQDARSDRNNIKQPYQPEAVSSDVLDRPAHWGSSKSISKKRSLTQPASSSSSKHRVTNNEHSQSGRKFVQVAHFSAKPLMLAPSQGTAASAVISLKPKWLSQLSDRPQSAPSFHIEDDRRYQQQQWQAMEVSDPVEDLPDNNILFPDSFTAAPVASTVTTLAAAVAPTFNRPPPEMHHSPLRGKQRQMSVKVGSIRWKLQKVIRECDALQQATLSPDTMSGLTGMHDPRSRVSLKLQATVIKCIGDSPPFVLFVVNFDQNQNNKDNEGEATTTEGILVLRKASAASYLLEGMKVMLYGPQTLPIGASTLDNPRLSILRSLSQENPLAECVLLCLAWEIVA